jgi:ssDNA-binding Zn-finger/Zn-ribbon topoisomerase 1
VLKDDSEADSAALKSAVGTTTSSALVEKCVKCGQGELVIRTGRNGHFFGCNRFPACKNTVSVGTKKKYEGGTTA